MKALGHSGRESCRRCSGRLRRAGTGAGSLHAKCAVADQATAFISSANLTEYALSLNMELGMLVKGGSLPRELAAHLRGLIQGRILVRCAAG